MRLNFNILILWVILLCSCSNTTKRAGQLDCSSVKYEDTLSLQQNIENLQKTSNPIFLSQSGVQYLLEVKVPSETSGLLKVPLPNVDHLKFFELDSLNYVLAGDLDTVGRRSVYDPFPIYEVNNASSIQKSVFILIKDKGPLSVNIAYLTKDEYASDSLVRNLMYGVFIGIMLAMIFYNLFIYVQLRYNDYLYYVLFLISMMIAQSALLGISFYFLDRYPVVNDSLVYIASGLMGVVGAKFIYDFIGVGERFYKVRRVYYYIYASYGLAIVFSFMGKNDWSHMILNINGLIAPLFLIANLYVAWRRDVQNAGYILVAWSSFFIGVLLFVLKDTGYLPNSAIVSYLMPVGASVSAILLSFALANRMSLLEKTTKETQYRLLNEVKKNERLIQDQNVTLEKKVVERTAELQQALDDLKAAQSKLVQAEKMASLGTLTAGIAHEINNPINFVSANVLPLRDNIADLTSLIEQYKGVNETNYETELARLAKVEQELDLEYTLKETKELVDGIEEGAKRTHTIVEGLTTFSRGDAGTKSKSDINRGIRSTLSVLKSRLNSINLKKELEEDLPLVSCQVGKINQVVLNLMNNALDALEERYEANSPQSMLTIKSWKEEDSIKILVSDNANGMDEETKEKILEPFYTTKPVGKGTGLGLSISYSIIEDHQGDIELQSEVGKGTTFTITLPINSPVDS